MIATKQNCSPIEEESQAVAAIRRLRSASDSLKVVLDQMEEKLRPVLSADIVEGCGALTRQASSVPLVDAIEVIAEEVSIEIQRMHAIIARLGI